MWREKWIYFIEKITIFLLLKLYAFPLVYVCVQESAYHWKKDYRTQSFGNEMEMLLNTTDNYKLYENDDDDILLRKGT